MSLCIVHIFTIQCSYTVLLYSVTTQCKQCQYHYKVTIHIHNITIQCTDTVPLQRLHSVIYHTECTQYHYKVYTGTLQYHYTVYTMSHFIYGVNIVAMHCTQHYYTLCYTLLLYGVIIHKMYTVSLYMNIVHYMVTQCHFNSVTKVTLCTL